MGLVVAMACVTWREPVSMQPRTSSMAVVRAQIGFTEAKVWNHNRRIAEQGNRIWSLRLLKAGSTSWGSGAVNSDRGCRNAEEPASVRSFARRKGSSAVNHLPDFSYAIALPLNGTTTLRKIRYRTIPHS